MTTRYLIVYDDFGNHESIISGTSNLKLKTVKESDTC